MPKNEIFGGFFVKKLMQQTNGFFYSIGYFISSSANCSNSFCVIFFNLHDTSNEGEIVAFVSQ